MNNFIRNQASRLNMAIMTIALLMAQTSCSDEVVVESMHATPLQINVTAAGFASGSPETRASDTEYATTFTAGDQIGITVIQNGVTILKNNVPYQYNNGAWAPVSADNKVYPYSGHGTITYLVYYPYSATMDGKKTADEILAAFTPQTNQSGYANYTKSDLMIANGTESGGTLTITLTHALSLVEINLPAGSTTPQLRVGDGVALTPYLFTANQYRCIVKPATGATLSGFYTTQEATIVVWQQSGINLEAGKYQKLSIN
jgi:hypothetical protein